MAVITELYIYTCDVMAEKCLIFLNYIDIKINHKMFKYLQYEIY